MHDMNGKFSFRRKPCVDLLLYYIILYYTAFFDNKTVHINTNVLSVLDIICQIFVCIFLPQAKKSKN